MTRKIWNVTRQKSGTKFLKIFAPMFPLVEGMSKRCDQIIENMRDIHKLKQENKLTINSSGVATAQEFSWENSANKILEIL